MERWKKYLLCILLPVLMLLPNVPEARAAENTASTMQLTKTEGTVDILSGSGKSITLIDDMRLYNGYSLETMEESYAWINLDKSKLAKLDAVSEASVRKSGKKLEILVDSGNLFFNVTEPLEEEESLNIRISTMVVGIRGTCGWIEILDEKRVRLTLLEGTVEVSVIDPVTGQVKKEIVTAGETVICIVYEQTKEGDKCDILRERCKKEDIRGFVLAELLPDAALVEKIYQDTGIDLRNLTEEEVEKRLLEDEDAVRKKLTELSEIARKQEEESSVDLVWTNGEEASAGGRQPAPVEIPVAVRRPVPAMTPAPVISPEPESGSDFGEESAPSGTPAPGSTEEGPVTTPSGTDAPGTTEEPVSSPVPTARPLMMPLTDDEVQAIVDVDPDVYILKNPDYADNGRENTLLVDSGLTIPAGQALAMEPGILISIDQGQSLRVDGTLNHSGAVENRGNLTVTSANTLKVGQNLVNSNRLIVPATGRIVVEGTLISDGSLVPTQGALIQARQFDLRRPVTAWAVSEGLDSEGYYRLVYVGIGGNEPIPAETYTVTFDSQGGSPVSGSVVNSGDRVGRPVHPTRSGYSFSGWFIDAACTTAYDFSSPVTGDLTLYAGWTANADVYTVTFDSQGGSSISPSAVTSGDKVGRPVHPTRSGYSFSGWFVDAACTTAFDFSSPITGDLTLYAGWTANADVYTVTFDSRGGSSISASAVTSGDKVGRPVHPTRSGYSFSGWFTDAACTAAYDFNLPVTGDLVLYAGWTADANVYTVTFDSQGGSSVSGSAVNSGDAVTRPSDPARSGYSFSGWFTDAACTAAYDFNLPVTGDLVLYAGWTADANVYTVTFDSQGGSSVSDAAVNSGSAVTMPADPARSGYTFNGWYTDAACTAAYDFTLPVTGDLILYAGWVADVVSYTVTFDSQGGSSVSDAAVNSGSAVTMPSDPARSGYTFNGWYTDAACTAAYDFTLPVTGDLILYAGWVADVVSYTVTFDSQGGSSVSDVSVSSGSTVTRPADPTHEHGTFNGWYTDAACTAAFDFDTPVTEDLTLYAGWILDTFPVLYDANGGHMSNVHQVEYGAKIPKQPDILPIRSGYILNGWYTDAACTTPYDFDLPLTGELTIYAGWTPDENVYTVTFESQGGSYVSVVAVRFGSAVTMPADPARSGYTFNGWYTDAACTAAYDFTLPVTGDLTLYAGWTEDNTTFTVTFNTNGYTLAEGAETQKTVQRGAAIGDLPATVPPLAATSTSGYDFSGWYTAPQGGEQVTSDTTVTKNMTLYAQWILWTFDEATGKLTISGRGHTPNYGINNLPWTPGAVQTAEVAEGTTDLGSNLFIHCENMTSVKLPDSLTSIGDSAFYQCFKLADVTIPNGVTSIGNSAFYQCDSLTDITLPPSVTSIGNSAFYHSALTSIVIPDSVTSIGDSAFGNTALVSITIPDSITNISTGMFSNCPGLTEVNMPDSITSIGGEAFRGCGSLQTIVIPDSVTSIGSAAFRGCGLAEITISGGVTDIGDSMFRECGNLADVTIPDSVTNIGGYAFADCSSLRSITLPGSVTSIGENAFAGSGLIEITLPESVNSMGNNVFWLCKSLTTAKILGNLSSISRWTFYDCSSLTTVSIPESVTSIGTNAFYGCNITDVYFGGTQEQWEALGYNPSNANIYYNSTAP